MNRRVLSLGGLTIAGASQAILGVLQHLRDSPVDPSFSVLGGLLVAGVFGRALVCRDDLNGLATRPLFTAVGVAAGVISAPLTAAAIAGP